MMGGEGAERRIRSCGLDECIERGKDAIGYDDLEQPAADHLHRGIGMALSAQGTGVAGDELGAAQIMMNEDGSFHLQVGGVDIGTGADTAFLQIAAEVLGCDEADIVVKSADTDVTPFDYGAYASSTTYISGMAVKKAAEDAKERILDWGSKLLDEPTENLKTGDGTVYSETSGDSVTLEDIGYEAAYGDDEREHILGKGTHCTEESPPPFAAQFADVTVDETTGEFEVHELVVAVDCGVAINPGMAEGQIEGANHMSYEMAVSEGITLDDEGRAEVADFDEYGLPSRPRRRPSSRFWSRPTSRPVPSARSRSPKSRPTRSHRRCPTPSETPSASVSGRCRLPPKKSRRGLTSARTEEVPQFGPILSAVEATEVTCWFICLKL